MPIKDEFNKPLPLKVEEGKKYLFCQCGVSRKEPLCDGSHCGTLKFPKRFTAEKTGTVVLCGCKKTATPPYCDGVAHKN